MIENKNHLDREDLYMETPAFVATIFVWCLLISLTGYSLYIGFGPPSKDLRDPFEEHED